MIDVEQIRDRDGLDALEPVWDGALAASGVHGEFLSFAWITSWWAHVAGDRELLVLVARDAGGAVTGIAPLMVTPDRSSGRRVVEFIGTPNADYADFIVVGDAEAVLGAFVETLTGPSCRWDSWRLEQIPEGSRTPPVVGAMLRRHRVPSTTAADIPCPTLLLAGNEDAIREELAQKRYIGKRKLRQSIDHLATRGPVTFRHAGTVDDAVGLLDTMIGFHVERWADEEPSKFEDPGYRELFRDVVRRSFAGGVVALSALEVGGAAIAVSISFPRGRVWTNHNWAYDRAFAKFSPGTLLIQWLITDAIDNGYVEFDFTRGAEPYKARFSNHLRYNSTFTAYGHRRDYAVLIARERLARAARTAKNGLRRRAPTPYEAVKRLRSRLTSSNGDAA